MKSKFLQFRLKQIALVALATATLTGLVISSKKVSADGAVAVPVQYSPESYGFGSLAPGQVSTGGVTVARSPSNVTVTASISDDTSGGRFGNLQTIVYDVQRSSNGRIIDVNEVGRSAGGAPIAVTRGQMVRVEFDYTAPNPPPSDAASAMLHILGESSNNANSPWQPIRVPLHANIGRVRTTLLEPLVEIDQAMEGDLPISIESLAGPQTTVSYALAVGPETQWITLDSNSFFVARGGTTQGNLHFRVDGRCPVGDYSLSLFEYAFNYGQSDLLVQHPVIRVLQWDPWRNATHPTKLLVIAPQQFENALQPLILHKNDTGMPALLMTIGRVNQYFSGRDDPERIKRCIADAHEKLGVQYVMLVGDASLLPVRYRYVNSIYETRPDLWWDGSYHASDLYYANLYHGHSASFGSIINNGVFDDWDQNRDGKYDEQFWIADKAWTMNPDSVDGCPDVAVGRVPAHTAADVTIYANKVIRYEMGNGFDYKTGRYTFLADKGYPGATDLSNQIIDYSGIGATVSENDICRVGLDYADSDQLTSPWVKGNFESMRVSVLGSSWISYIGHGWNLGWGVLGGYDNQKVRALDNRNALPIVFSASCQTGLFAPYLTEPEGTMEYRDLAGQAHRFQYDRSRNVVVDVDANNVSMPVPIVFPTPNPYDFPYRDNLTFACSWLVGPNEGGAIAYFGEVLVCENDHGTELEKRVLAQYVKGGQRVLGDVWLKGEQQYWKDFERDENVFQAPRIYLGIMTFFGDPSLRLR